MYRKDVSIKIAYILHKSSTLVLEIVKLHRLQVVYKNDVSIKNDQIMCDYLQI